MNDVEKLLNEYLAVRRSLGFDLKKHEFVLREFVSFFTAQESSYLTAKLALEWACLPQDTDPAWWGERLGILCAFAKHWKTVDPQVEVPHVRHLFPTYKRPAPYIYTESQIAQILKAALELPSEDGCTYWALFGLLAVTGLRIGEALALNEEDVDLDHDMITVRNAKSGTKRLLPIHKSTCEALCRYVLDRDRRFKRRDPNAFFVVLDGRRASHHMPWSMFRKVLAKLGIRPLFQKKGPRLHDLRHTFAVGCLMRFYQEWKDVDRQIHLLSEYLGHTSIRCTYWYLTAVPELMSLALDRLEKKTGGTL